MAAEPPDGVPSGPPFSKTDDGRSAVPNVQGPNDVADPHVPMTWCEVWPVAVPSVRTAPEIAQVSQLAPAAEHAVAPVDGGGYTPNPCAFPWGASQQIRTADKGKMTKRLKVCIKSLLSYDGRYILTILL